MLRLNLREWLLLGVCGLPAVAGMALITARIAGAPADAAPTGQPAPVTQSAPAVRLVCSLSNDDARAVMVQGADGGLSIPAPDGASVWFFGDTLFLPESGKHIEANTIASSRGVDAAGCPRLDYHRRDGVAAPFIDKDGSLTVWPSGARVRGDRAIDLYTVYVYGSGAYDYWIGEVGLARLDPRTMQLTVLARTLWDAGSGHRSQIVAAQPIDQDDAGRLRVVLEADDGTKLLARVHPDAMHIAAAYEYWQGSGWSADPAMAEPLWTVLDPVDPVERLGAFENSAHIAWNAARGLYVAVMNTDLATISARTAGQLEGPWSEPEPLVDCLRFAQPAVPTCYSPIQHPELSPDGGATLVLTATHMATYETVVYELKFESDHEP